MSIFRKCAALAAPALLALPYVSLLSAGAVGVQPGEGQALDLADRASLGIGMA